jgi:hypothetical protein
MLTIIPDILASILSFVKSPYDAHSLMSASNEWYEMSREWRKMNWGLGNIILKPYQVNISKSYSSVYNISIIYQQEICMLAMAKEYKNAIIMIADTDLDLWKTLTKNIGLYFGDDSANNVVEFITEPDRWRSDYAEEKYHYFNVSGDEDDDEDDEDYNEDEGEIIYNDTLIKDNNKIYITTKGVKERFVITNCEYYKKKLLKGDFVMFYNYNKYADLIYSLYPKNKDEQKHPIITTKENTIYEQDEEKIAIIISNILTDIDELYVICPTLYHISYPKSFIYLPADEFPIKDENGNSYLKSSKKIIYLKNLTEKQNEYDIRVDNILVINMNNIAIKETLYNRDINITYLITNKEKIIKNRTKNAINNIYISFYKRKLTDDENIRVYNFIKLLNINFDELSDCDILVLFTQTTYKNKLYTLWKNGGDKNKLKESDVKTLLSL